MALKKIISISAVLVFTSQLVFANYAFYRQVVNTCKLYRMPVDEKKMAKTNNAKFMHCLPVRRNVVVDDNVIDSENSLVISQAKNSIYSALIILKKLIENER